MNKINKRAIGQLQRRFQSPTKKIVSFLTRDPRVLAICIYGSVARNYADVHTKDIDMWVVARPSLADNKKARVQLCQQIKGAEVETETWLPAWVKTEIFYLNGLEVNIVFHKPEEVRAALKNWPANPKVQYFPQVIDSCVVLYDSRKLVKQWKAKLKMYPQDIRAAILTGFVRYLWKFYEYIERALERADLPYFQEKINLELQDFLHALFALNRKYYDQPKWLDRRLAQLKFKPKRCYQRIERLIKTPTTKKNLGKKLRVIDLLLYDLVQIIRKKAPSLVEEGFYARYLTFRTAAMKKVK